MRLGSAGRDDLFGADVHDQHLQHRQINKEESPRGRPRMRRLQETIGESYYDYLSKLDDLVLLMDEAHRYRASAGARAISELRPILGLELTATPKTVGARSQDFRNVIYSYGLGQAMADGFVKEPAVATRKDFDPSSVSAARLERIKLEDAVHYHDHVAVELDRYARVSGRPQGASVYLGGRSGHRPGPQSSGSSSSPTNSFRAASRTRSSRCIRRSLARKAMRR